MGYGGRPTNYSPEILDKTRAYVDGGWEGIDEFPQISGLAIFLGITRKTIYEWMKEEDKAEFCDMTEQLMARQENVLLNKSIVGDFNPTITKLALTRHGYHDKTETEISGEIRQVTRRIIDP